MVSQKKEYPYESEIINPLKKCSDVARFKDTGNEIVKKAEGHKSDHGGRKVASNCFDGIEI